MSYIAHSWRRARQREGRRGRAPCGADEFGDASKPLLVEVVDGAVTQELACHEQHGLRVRWARRAWDDEPAGVSDGVAVRPSRRTEGCSQDTCCSFPAGPVTALAAGNEEQRGGPPTGAVWASKRRERPGAQRARQASDMDATKRWDANQWKEDFSAPLPGTPNVVFRVPEKPLRFEHWGAHKDFPLPNISLSLAATPKLISMNSQDKRHKIYTGSGHHCGVIPYSCVVVVDCLLG